jgi:hypothetical protein
MAGSRHCDAPNVSVAMSALGQKQTSAPQKVMSALPPKADICSALAHVRFGPKADMGVCALDQATLHFAIDGVGPKGSFGFSSIFAACKHESNSV